MTFVRTTFALLAALATLIHLWRTEAHRNDDACLIMVSSLMTSMHSSWVRAPQHLDGAVLKVRALS